MLSVNFKGKILHSSFFTLNLLKKGFAPRTYIIRTREKNPYNLNTYKKITYLMFPYSLQPKP